MICLKTDIRNFRIQHNTFMMSLSTLKTLQEDLSERIELTLDTPSLFGDSRCFDHSSRFLRWRLFIFMNGRVPRIIFSAVFQSSAKPNATSTAHVTHTLLPWPVDCSKFINLRKLVIFQVVDWWKTIVKELEI